MRNLDKLLFLPLLAAISFSCSSPSALQTSEYDDVYYSSKDKTVTKENVPTVASNTVPENEIPSVTNNALQSDVKSEAIRNPEYSERASGITSTGSDNYYSDDYYDEDDYYYSSRIRRFHTPYRGFSYYDYAYTDYYWYNRNPIYFGRTICYDPFFNGYYPSYAPYWGYPGYGNSVAIIINTGWGNPYGGYGGFGRYYGGFNNGFNRGYNRGYYNGFNNGYYANGGLYRNDNYNNNNGRKVQYGPRDDRSSVPSGNKSVNGTRPRGQMGGTIPDGGLIVNPSNPIPASTGERTSRRGNAATDTGVTPGGTNTGGSVSEPRNGRRERSVSDSQIRTTDSNINGTTSPTLERPTRRTDAPTYEAPQRATPTEGNLPINIRQRQDRTSETVMPSQPQRTMEQAPTRRTEQMPARRYEEPAQPASTPRYEAPTRREQPVYQAPSQRQPETRPTPTYEAPRRETPAYQAPQRQESRPSSPPPSSGGSSNDSGGRSGRPRN